MSKNLQQASLAQVYRVLSEAAVIVESDKACRAVFRLAGWDVDAIFEDIGELRQQLSPLVESRRQLAAYLQSPPDSLSEFKDALVFAHEITDHTRQLASLFKSVKLKEGVAEDIDLETIAQDVMKQFLVFWLRREKPLLCEGLALLKVLFDAELTEPVTDDAGNVIRMPYRPVNFRLERIAELWSTFILDGREAFCDRVAGYWETPENYYRDVFQKADSARRFSDLWFRTLAILANAGAFGVNRFGTEWHFDGLYGIQPEYKYPFDSTTADLLSRMLVVRRAADVLDDTANLVIVIDPDDRGGNGLVFAPSGNVDLRERIGEWDVTFLLKQSGGGFAAHLDKGVKWADLSQTLDVSAALTATRGNEKEPALVVGGARGTRLEIGRLMLSGEFALTPTSHKFGLALRASKSAFVLAAGDGDGFLRSVLPEDGLRYEFDLGMGWTDKRGFYLEGGGAVDTVIPVNKTIHDTLTVESAYLSIKPEDDRIPVHVAASLRLKLGPVTAVVDRVGLKLDVGFSNELRGNLGPVNLDLGFRPPDGLGLVVDSGPVVGGGYIFYDAANEQYAGTLYLEINKYITLSAVGLLTTRMPDGSQGFSLLLLVSAKGFPPVQLGYGFTLLGVGGLLGVNRSAVVEEMRAGLKERTLDALLFPVDPVKNAQQYVSSLQRVFPPAPGRYIFGPMVTIGWGTPQPLVTFELALLLELPEPVRLLAAGRVKATFPTPSATVILLQMDAFGVLDFELGEASLDATLRDSRLASFPVTGDMALRANWGDAPDFVMSLGGFHPHYTPPADFPKLERLAINLSTADNPRLRLDAYLALTPSTLQFGAYLDFYAAESGYVLRGGFGFDSLFQFEPFQFSTNIRGHIDVRKDGELVVAAYLDFVLNGPNPWRAVGKATFEYAGVNFEVDFDESFGAKQELSPPPKVNLQALLKAALTDARSWSGQLPSAGQLVTLKLSSGSDGVLAHPLGNLTLRQRTAPLKVDIALYGSTRLAATNFFELAPSITNLTVAPSPVTDAFAVAHYFPLSDSEKLSRPSFEQMESGFSFAYEGAKYAVDLVDLNLVYDTVLIDPSMPPAPRLAALALSASTLSNMVGQSAAANTPTQTTGNAKFRGDDGGSSVGETKYLIVVADNLAPSTIGNIDPNVGVSYAKADEELRKVLVTYPEKQGEFLVLGLHELT